MTSVILRPKTKEYLEGLKEVMDGSALALRDGYKYLFLSEVTHLLTAYDYSLEDVRNILSGQSPSYQYRPLKNKGMNGHSARLDSGVNNAVKTATRREKKYRNPHTGETISLRSAKNKVLKLWQEEYGVETVEQWRVG